MHPAVRLSRGAAYRIAQRIEERYPDDPDAQDRAFEGVSMALGH